MMKREPYRPSDIELICDVLDEKGIEYHLETKLFIHQSIKTKYLELDDFSYVSDNLDFLQIIFSNYFK
jgi:organic radical activating enzyme